VKNLKWNLTGGISEKLKADEIRERMGLELPAKPKELFDDIVSGKIRRAVVAACRGGGKSWTVAGIETAMFGYKGFDWFNIGGSKTQAKKVFDKSQDFIRYDPQLAKDVIKSIQSETKHVDGQFISVAAASSTQIRSQHFGGKNHGGGLTIDEEDEADESIVKGALPTINTAHPSVIIRMSTRQKRIGTFSALCKNHKKLGYKFYQWDAFDICDKCTDNCKECFPEFRDKYCKSKAKNNKFGWIAISEIKQAWRESDENADWFEVEYMGWEVSKGLLVYDQDDIKKCEVQSNQFIRGNPTFLGIDWGWLKDRTVLLILQFQGKQRLVITTKTLTKPSNDLVKTTVRDLYNKYHFDSIYPDSSHPYENNELAIQGYHVVPVVFSKEKETGIANVNNGLEHGWYSFPVTEVKLITQLINYKRDKDGKPVKVDDHFCDALLCASEPVKPRIKNIAEASEDEEVEIIEEIEREII